MNIETTATEKLTLYQRLGGEPGLRELVDEVVERIAENPFLEYYFHNIDRGRVRILAYEYVAMRAGGPEQYTGQDLHSAFFSLNIRPEEYQYAMDDTIFILNEKGIDQPEKKEVIAILEDLRADIIRTKSTHH